MKNLFETRSIDHIASLDSEIERARLNLEEAQKEVDAGFFMVETGVVDIDQNEISDIHLREDLNQRVPEDWRKEDGVYNVVFDHYNTTYTALCCLFQKEFGISDDTLWRFHSYNNKSILVKFLGADRVAEIEAAFEKED